MAKILLLKEGAFSKDRNRERLTKILLQKEDAFSKDGSRKKLANILLQKEGAFSKDRTQLGSLARAGFIGKNL